MGRKKRHSLQEIAAKLRQAEDMAAAGKLQNEIARALGISVMTYHRWRKLPPETLEAGAQRPAGGAMIPEPGAPTMDNLLLENARLRRLVADLLLDKLKLEESIQRQEAKAQPLRRRS